MPIYFYILCNTPYFVLFPEVVIVSCSGRYIQKGEGRVFRNVRGCNIFQGFARVNCQFNFTDIFRNMHFFVLRFNTQCPRNSQWEVHMKRWWTLQKLSLMKLLLQLIFIVSSKPWSSPGTPFPQVSHLSPILTGRTTSKTALLTSKTALLCVFSSILNHSQANQKNSIIKG